MLLRSRNSDEDGVFLARTLEKCYISFGNRPDAINTTGTCLRSDRKSMPTDKKLKIMMLEDKFSISKLPQFGEIPVIFTKGDMCFTFRTDDELTIICPEFMAPNNVEQEAGWRCLKVLGNGSVPKEVGILATITQPLSEANIPLCCITTFSSVLIFLMEEHLVKAVHVLQQLGHEFVPKEA